MTGHINFFSFILPYYMKIWRHVNLAILANSLTLQLQFRLFSSNLSILKRCMILIRNKAIDVYDFVT